MTIDNWLRSATKKLADSQILTARLDSLVLLEDCLSIDRAHILARPEQILSAEHIKWLDERLERRAKHEPLAYIREKCEFYGRTFFVDEHVLVPRPETEPIIDFMKKLPAPGSIRVADIGSGSGCIGITVALELPNAIVDLYDIDSSTFNVSKHNAEAYKADVSFHTGNLLQDLVENYDVIIANLPYVPDGKPENVDVYFEPSHALFAGNDGLDLYREFWRQLHNLQHKPQYILTESRPKYQQPTLVELAMTAGYKLASTDDFIQEFELG